MDYKEVIIHVDESFNDQLMAELSVIGFESFIQESNLLKAYAPEKEFARLVTPMGQLLDKHPAVRSWEDGAIPEQNWNENWERDYAPVMVEDKVKIRAPFHQPAEQGVIDLVVQPQMSFGTGHHQTTSLMVAAMLDIDFSGKTVLDMGCGTGVLAILAARLGADNILAIDNHPWAVKNTTENISRNPDKGILVLEGETELLQGRDFDIILANINRNVLLMHIPAYARVLKPKGSLLLSGFFDENLPELSECAANAGLRLSYRNSKQGWTVALFIKS